MRMDTPLRRKPWMAPAGTAGGVKVCHPRVKSTHERASGVPAIIYKICDVALWRAAERERRFDGAKIDARDGYIHFSTAEQVVETAARYFAGGHDLLLIAVDADSLGVALKWEPSRGGALFPHLYGPLSLDAVRWVKPLPIGADGRHVFPELSA
jgi:uncharacterized protein (DUF952 family)